MSFTDNTRDEVTLIFLKHKYLMNAALLISDRITYDTVMLVRGENLAIRKTFEEVRERNTRGVQGGTYEEIGKLCDEFLKSVAEAEGVAVS